MTAGAGRVGWAKCRADMTSFAGDIGVRAVEIKTRTKMIKRLLSVCSSLEQQKTDCSEHHDAFPVERTIRIAVRILSGKDHCSDLTSSNELSLWQRPQSDPNSLS